MGYFSISDSVTSGDGKPGPEIVVIVASGELDQPSNSPQLRGRILGHIGAGARYVLLDLSAVTFIDSTAIGTLVDAVTRLRGSGGGALAVVCTEDNERVRENLRHRRGRQLDRALWITVDFNYWPMKMQAQAIDVLRQAAKEAYPDLSRQFNFEAARKLTEAKRFPEARDLLAIC